MKAPAQDVNAIARSIEADAERVHRMNVSERIAYWDKRQCAKDDQVIYCQNDRDHGAMTIDKSGALLVCCKTKNGAYCTSTYPVSV